MDFNKTEDIILEDTLLRNFANLSEEESEMIRDWRNNEDNRKWMYQDHIITAQEHSAFMKNVPNDKRNIFYLVSHKEGDHIGVLCFNKIDYRNGNAYFGMYSNPQSKRPGVGRLLDKAAIEIAFNRLHLHTLRLEVIEDNKGVINMHKKFGFSEEGRLKEYVFKDNVWKDIIVMGMVKKPA